MKIILTLFLIHLFAFLVVPSQGYAANLDSLEHVLKTTDDEDVKIETTIEIGQHYRMLAMDTAIVIFNKAIEMASQLGNRELAAKGAIALAGHYAYAAEDTEKAHEVACKARDLIQYLGDTSKLYINYCGRAQIYGGMFESDQGNYAMAQEYFLNGIDYFERIGEQRSALLAYSQLIVLYTMQNMNKEAEEVLTKTILLCRENAWPREETIFLTNKGRVQYQQGKYEESILTTKKSERMVFDQLDTNDYYNLGYMYEQIGDNYFQLNNYDSSFFYHNKARYCVEKLNIQSSLINSYSNLARDCAMRGDLDLAGTYCNKMQKEIQRDSIQLPFLRLIGCQAWINYYKRSGQYDLAVDKMDTLLMLKESMINEQNIQEQTAQKMDFEFEKERLLTEKEIELKNENIATEKAFNDKLFSGLVLVTILSLTLLFVIYSNFKKRRIISQQNESLSNSVTEKETLLKEIHHRVKNNLQLVSSLLSLQSESIDDKQITSVFEEGQNRVQAMALIHQKLYQNDTASDIDFQDYLSSLVEHFNEVNIGQKEVSIKVDCEDVRLDIDTAIPLGLIVNELFTNSFKHAFKNIDLPKLSISVKSIGKGEYSLKMTDNGQGLPPDLDWAKTKTLGLRLIRNLVKQLIGKINYENHENLSVFSIQFKNQLGRNLID